MIKQIYHFFDKLEDHIRAKLGRYPIVYAIIGAVGIVLFWSGVERTVDMIPWVNGPMLILVSLSVLLATGLFVSFFIGDSILLRGMKKEDKTLQKTESEVRTESQALDEIRKELQRIEIALGTYEQKSETLAKPETPPVEQK